MLDFQGRTGTQHVCLGPVEGQEDTHLERVLSTYVGYQLTDHTCIEGGEESVESLGRVVGLSVCIAEPLEG